jgi:hypothetical protein
MIKQDDNLSQRFIMILVSIKFKGIKKSSTTRQDTTPAFGWRDQMPQKVAGVKARPQNFQVQMQTTALQHSILQLEESAHSICLTSRFCQYLRLYTFSGRTIGE